MEKTTSLYGKCDKCGKMLCEHDADVSVITDTGTRCFQDFGTVIFPIHSALCPNKECQNNAVMLELVEDCL